MTEHRTPLGEPTPYPKRYAPELLCAVPRLPGRLSLAIDNANPPFNGADLWTAYEVSWLDLAGKPEVRIGEFTVPCTSPNLIESKSLKLYLNSLNQWRFGDCLEVEDVVRKDLSAVCGAPVAVTLCSLDDYGARGINVFTGECVDALNPSRLAERPEAELLVLSDAVAVVDEVLYSHLFKSNCPVTGQPDWASIQISYRGRAIDRSALLAYLISFRNHQNFHEHCVERLFVDIRQRCAPVMLTVMARYTRRGGLDINPARSTDPIASGWLRLARQ